MDPTPPMLLLSAIPDERTFLWLRDSSVVMLDHPANTLLHWHPNRSRRDGRQDRTAHWRERGPGYQESWA